ncbi:thioredoxin-like 1-1, chloroplastic [Oryza brachyantha]|uniref:Thioredoxin domain-containing protein n=1 Tax=Oryza brachyantha TaxID=4533 RepID=J3LKE4_ORYBR|nr:thioredoxin-like 1-1, chloroplastic [Oryza brachyantha]
MAMASALTNNWVISGSSQRGSKNNNSDGSFMVPARNHNVINRKHLLLQEKDASTGWQVTKAAPENSINAIHTPMKTKWWEKNMKFGNMKNIESQEDFDKQLLLASDKLTVVHFFSPSCGACKALHPKVCQLAGMHPELQFLMVNCNEHKEMCQRLNVHVLPMFRFYRGAEGRICSFSCTISTIHKIKDALERHGVQLENLGPEKGLEEPELQNGGMGAFVPNNE